MFTLNDEYTLKLACDMIRNEKDRIVSMGLATSGDLRKWIDPIIRQASDETLLVVLNDLYNNLKSICLRGDFERLSSKNSLMEILFDGNDPVGMGRGGPPGSGPNPECPLKKDKDKDEKDSDREDEDEKDSDREDNDENEDDAQTSEVTSGAEEAVEEGLATPESGLVTIYSALEDMAYKHGTMGNHKTAYKIERTIRNIKHIASSLSNEDIKKMINELNNISAG
jgi:hypothetical protein